MEFLDIKLTLPMDINMDNKGAMFLAKNEQASQRTKHIDVKYHYIRQHVEEGIVKINLVKSEDNTSDVFTKNLGYKLYWEHVLKFMDWDVDRTSKDRE